MKKTFLVILGFFLMSLGALSAQKECSFMSAYNQYTIINALNLTNEQQIQKNELDKKFSEEILNINAQTKEENDKQVAKLTNKYDDEFQKILTSSQKIKYKEIKKSEKLYQKIKPNKDIRPFGVKTELPTSSQY